MRLPFTVIKPRLQILRLNDRRIAVPRRARSIQNELLTPYFPFLSFSSLFFFFLYSFGE